MKRKRARETFEFELRDFNGLANLDVILGSPDNKKPDRWNRDFLFRPGDLVRVTVERVRQPAKRGPR